MPLSPSSPLFSPGPVGSTGAMVMEVAFRLVPSEFTVPTAWIFVSAARSAFKPSSNSVSELMRTVRVNPSRSVTVTVLSDTEITVPSMRGWCAGRSAFLELLPLSEAESVPPVLAAYATPAPPNTR